MHCLGKNVLTKLGGRIRDKGRRGWCLSSMACLGAHTAQDGGVHVGKPWSAMSTSYPSQEETPHWGLPLISHVPLPG